jgi:hypothetical protein
MPELAARSAAPFFFSWRRHTIFPERACAKDSKQPDQRVPQSSIPDGSTHAGSAGLNAEQIAFRSCTGIYSYRDTSSFCSGPKLNNVQRTCVAIARQEKPVVCLKCPLARHATQLAGAEALVTVYEVPSNGLLSNTSTCRRHFPALS